MSKEVDVTVQVGTVKCKACRGKGTRWTRETHGGNPEPHEKTCYHCNGKGVEP